MCLETVKVKLSRYRPEQALGGSGRLRLRMFITFDTMKVVGRQPYAPAVFAPRSILVHIFRDWVDPRAHGSVGSYRKKSPATPLGIDPETLGLVVQRLNHYATPSTSRRLCPAHSHSCAGCRLMTKTMRWAKLGLTRDRYTSQEAKGEGKYSHIQHAAHCK
jgi:hypothetical protein